MRPRPHISSLTSGVKSPLIPLLVASGVALAWSMTHQKFRSLAVTGPMLMATIGLATGWIAKDVVAESVDTGVALQVSELILALLLFTNAIHIRSSLRVQFHGPASRLLVVALPLSLFVVTAIGLLLPLQLSFGAVLVVACIAVPADYSTDLVRVRGGRTPDRVARWLGAESGYNDGLLTPVLLVAITLATPRVGSVKGDVLEIALGAVPSILLAALVGVFVGTLSGGLLRIAFERGWADVQSARIGVLALPVLSYAFSVSIGGNGFIAAFVCGIAYRVSQGRRRVPSDTLLAEDLGSFLSLLLWLGFGTVAALLISDSYDWWPAVLLAVLGITVGRALPVAISLLGSRTSLRDLTYMAAVGPKGPASIVFALIAFQSLPPSEGYPVLAAGALVILSSLLIHGLGVPILTKRLYPTR